MQLKINILLHQPRHNAQRTTHNV